MTEFASYKKLETIVDKAQRKIITTDEAFKEVISLMESSKLNGSFYLDDHSYIHYRSYNDPNPHLRSGGGSIIKMPDENTTFYNPMSDVLDKLDDETKAMKWIAMRLNLGLDEPEERELFIKLFYEKKTVRYILSLMNIGSRAYYKILEETNKKARDVLILIPMD